MTYQEALIPLIEDAYNDLFKNAQRIADKLDYKAAPTCRTPLDMVVECVTSPHFLAPTIANRALAPMDEESYANHGITSLEAAQAAWEAAKPSLYAAIREFPSDQLEVPIETPWGTFPWRDFIAYCYWNPMWHAGQLAYIQTIHGDTDMSF